MAESYRFTWQGGTGELTEKKSRFIATVAPVKSEEEAQSFIEQTKKKYWDARHNCTAFTIGSQHQLTRCSDDGEPSGTAGRPMLEVLLGEEIRNIVVVVTRYFGGTLLGTGGLVRAYTQAVKEGLCHCKIGVMRHGYEIRISTDYNGIGRILYLLGQRGIEPVESSYGEEATLLLHIPAGEVERLSRDVAEAVCGRAQFEKGKEIYYIDKESDDR